MYLIRARLITGSFIPSTSFLHAIDATFKSGVSIRPLSELVDKATACEVVELDVDSEDILDVTEFYEILSDLYKTRIKTPLISK